MSKFILLLAVFTTASSSMALAADAVEVAQKNYEQAIDLFNQGEITRTDVAAAQLISLEARYSVQAISKTQYCYEGYDVGNTLVAGAEEQARFYISLSEAAKKALNIQSELSALCSAK